MIARRGRQCGVDIYPHRFRHHFSHTSFDGGGAERDLIVERRPGFLRFGLFAALTVPMGNLGEAA
jgi:hypothetical protein